MTVELALHDHLRATLALGLEQHGVHIDLSLHAGCLGLGHRRPADFVSFQGDSSVEGYILGFEGGHPVAILGKDTAQSRYQDGLTGIGVGPQDHYCIGGHRIVLVSDRY